MVGGRGAITMLTETIKHNSQQMCDGRGGRCVRQQKRRRTTAGKRRGTVVEAEERLLCGGGGEKASQ